jgi:hypothetical protein
MKLRVVQMIWRCGLNGLVCVCIVADKSSVTLICSLYCVFNLHELGRCAPDAVAVERVLRRMGTEVFVVFLDFNFETVFTSYSSTRFLFHREKSKRPKRHT